jgi:hypothetical protein
MKNIFYIALYGTCGYAISAKYFIFNYLMHGYNVTFIPQYVDNTKIENPDIIESSVEACKEKFYDSYDLCIINFLPDQVENFIQSYKKYFNNPNIKIVLQTTWETTTVPPKWMKFYNSPNLHEIWASSEYTKKIFEANGITTKIKVNKYLSYNFIVQKNKDELNIPEYTQYGNKNIRTTYNFYNIATWNHRKNNINTIKTYCDTFTENDNVALIMKTNYYYYTDESINIIKKEIEDIRSKYINPPDIVVFFGNYSTNQINEIHNLGDCYYLLHRGEGLGYASYEAYLNHKPVIVTKYGGHIDYFTENYPYLVDYTMCDVFGMEFANFYDHYHQWAEPNYEHAKQLLLNVYNKHNIK